MAAPTNVRVEATSISSVMLRWSYSGSSVVSAYRSTDGMDYDPIGSVASITTELQDDGLTIGTKYWYKLSDDGGSTFSDVVTVYTHSCAGPVSDANELDLPPFLDPTEITPERLNEVERRIEAALGGQRQAPDQCIACPEEGAVVLDCSTGCVNWTVIADQDINSISINWCNQFDGTIDFVIPPNTPTRRICGFPAGFGFSGDECTKAPVSGGTKGRTMSVGFNGGGAGGGGVNPGASSSRNRPKPDADQLKKATPGGGGGGGCTCVPEGDNELTIKSCNENNSLDCSGSKSLRLIACGGRGPYTWSKTGSIVLSRTEGNTTTVTPPTNSGSGVAGTAYTKVLQGVKDSNSIDGDCTQGGAAVNVLTWQDFGCNDQSLGSIQSGNNTGADESGCGHSTESAAPCKDGDCEEFGDPTGINCPNARMVGANTDTATALGIAGATACDRRTAGMISDGCVPCGVMSGATVTVEDALGNQATIIVRP